METTVNLSANHRQRRWSDRADIAGNCRGRLVAIAAMSVAIVGWLILDQVSSMVVAHFALAADGEVIFATLPPDYSPLGQEQIVLVNNAVEALAPARPLRR